MSLSEKLRKEISDIPGDLGWYKRADQETFEEIAEALLECGLDEIQVLETLQDAYCAVANEFGA